jgi:hypothetical protein
MSCRNIAAGRPGGKVVGEGAKHGTRGRVRSPEKNLAATLFPEMPERIRLSAESRYAGFAKLL